MYRPKGPKLTADEVKQLPEGTKIIRVGRDPRGYQTRLVCVIENTPRSKCLRYRDYQGNLRRESILQVNGTTRWYEEAQE